MQFSSGTPRVLTFIVALAGVGVLVLAYFGFRSGGLFNNFTPSSIATREPVPANTVVPNANTPHVSEDIALPKVVVPANPQGTDSLRSFSLVAQNGKFTPNTAVVYKNDTVRLDITAVDQDYDFVQPDYGFREQIPKGTTKTISFQVTAQDKFVFFCERCGGRSSEAVGYIVVVPR